MTTKVYSIKIKSAYISNEARKSHTWLLLEKHKIIKIFVGSFERPLSKKVIYKFWFNLFVVTYLSIFILHFDEVHLIWKWYK